MFGLVCDLGRRQCVECVEAADCLGENEVCRANACVATTPCTTSRECPGLVCDRTLGYCVECITETDCADGEICEQSTCLAPPPPCDSDRDCSAGGRVCDLGTGRCVDCVVDDDCGAGSECTPERVCMPSLDGGSGDAGMDAGVDRDAAVDGGPPPSALLIADWEGTGHGDSLFRPALSSAGWTYSITGLGPALAADLPRRAWDLLILSIAMPQNRLTEGDRTLIAGWVAGGGRLIILFYELHRDGEAMRLGLDVVPATRSPTSRAVVRDPTSPVDFFTGMPSSGLLPCTDTFSEKGNPLTVDPSLGFLAGRLDTATGPGGIAVTHGGRVIVCGFIEPEYSASFSLIRPADGDADGIPDAQELFTNMLRYIRPPR